MVKVQYPGVGQALRSDLRQARLLARVMARLTRLNVSGLADELAGRIAEELDHVREGSRSAATKRSGKTWPRSGANQVCRFPQTAWTARPRS
jgi:predicted unusual protein kinase regulating ubiquinone biosynthesis (AarF/ABC1/UbiB family)